MASRKSDEELKLGSILIVDTLNRIDQKIDKLDDRLDNHGQVLVRQQAILDEHVRRTNLLEKKIDEDTKKYHEELPINVHKYVDEHITKKAKSALVTTGKIAGAIAATSGGGFGVMQIIKWIAHLWG